MSTRQLSDKNIVLRVTILYIIFSGAWIVFSDLLIEWLAEDSWHLIRMQIAKGQVFVIVTGVLLYITLAKYLRSLTKTRSEKLGEAESKRKMAERLEHYLNLAPSVIYTLKFENENASAVWVSRSVKNILGYTIEEAKEPGWWEKNIHPEDKDNAVSSQSLLFEKGSLRHEYRFLKKDGSMVWLHDEIKAADVQGGRGAVGTWTDITERKKQEEDIMERDERLQVLYDLSLKMRSATKTSELLSLVSEEARRLFATDDVYMVFHCSESSKKTVATGKGIFEKTGGGSFSSQCMCGFFTDSREPYISRNYSADPFEFFSEFKEKMGPALFVPIMAEESARLGGLAVSRRRGEDDRLFSGKDAELLSAVGELAGNTFRRIELFEDLRRNLQHVRALRNIDLVITGSLDLRGTFRVIIDEVMTQLGMDAACLLRFNPHLRKLECEEWRGFKKVNPEEFTWNLGEGPAGIAAQTKQAFHYDAGKASAEKAGQYKIMEEEGFILCFAVPLIAKGLLLGVLEVFSRAPLEEEEELKNFLETLAGQASIAIDNAELFHNLERSNRELVRAYDSTLEGWAHALDLKDEETEEHSRRVTEMTVRIAMKMGLEKEDLAHAYRGALLHDIGKMGIPDSILLKPGKLTNEEWAVMKRHPDYAFRLLSPIDYLRPAIDIPYCHHERWDGTGYPRGLKGGRIPLPARIFAVVDVWDALSSDRPYRKAWPKEKVLEHIREESGKHFDPEVVDVFLETLEKGKAWIAI